MMLQIFKKIFTGNMNKNFAFRVQAFYYNVQEKNSITIFKIDQIFLLLFPLNYVLVSASELSDKEAAKLNPKVSGDPCRWGEWH